MMKHIFLILAGFFSMYGYAASETSLEGRHAQMPASLHILEHGRASPLPEQVISPVLSTASLIAEEVPHVPRTPI